MDPLPERPPPARPLGETVRAWVHWFGVARLVATTCAVVGVSAGAFWLLRAPAAPIEAKLPYASTSSSVAGSSSSGAATTTVSTGPAAAAEPSAAATTDTTQVAVAPSVVVYVAGAVVSPGVYALPPGSRVQAAVVAAGGLGPDADADQLNLAAVVSDGDRVFIPRVGQSVPAVVLPSGGTSTGTVGSGPGQGSVATHEIIDINDASAEELDSLPGIGPSTAAAIVAHRDQFGPFATVDDLLDVRGIGPAKLDAIRALVTA